MFFLHDQLSCFIHLPDHDLQWLHSINLQQVVLCLPPFSLLFALWSFESEEANFLQHLEHLECLHTSEPTSDELEYWTDISLALESIVGKLPHLQHLRIGSNCVPSESSQSWFRDHVETLDLVDNEEVMVFSFAEAVSD